MSQFTPATPGNSEKQEHKVYLYIIYQKGELFKEREPRIRGMSEKFCKHPSYRQNRNPPSKQKKTHSRCIKKSLRHFLRLRGLFCNEADSGTRTRDLLITNQLLYQLSHISITERYYNTHRRKMQVNSPLPSKIPSTPSCLFYKKAAQRSAAFLLKCFIYYQFLTNID